VVAGRLAVVGLVLAAGVVMLFGLRSGVQGWLAWVNEPLGQGSPRFLLPPVPTPPAVGAQAGRPAPTPVPPPPTIAAAPNTAPGPAATSAASARPTATPGSTTGVTRRIVNTDGQGVALRASPGGDRLPGKGYDEGATVTAFESSGEWTHIRGSDGREGWVLSVTLAP
jgi:hypothetical protein